MDFSSNDTKRVYRQPLNYENGVLLPLIRDIAYWRVMNPKSFENGIQTLCIMLPKTLRNQALKFWNRGTTHEDLTMDGKKDFDDLLVYVLELLEDNNICFPKLSYQEGIL
jgi:hypothetical protein